MRTPRGFSLIELLIVVAIIGIIAAIAIPALLRARVNANEAATIGDIRTLITANSAYQTNTPTKLGYAPSMACLSSPSACLPNYTTSAPTFLDPALAQAGLVTKSGYNRTYFTGNALNSSEADSYCYAATPTTMNRTGVKSFGGSGVGVIGEVIGLAPVNCCVADGAGAFMVDVVACPVLR